MTDINYARLREKAEKATYSGGEEQELADAVLTLLDEIDGLRAEAREAHDALVLLAVELNWATDGKLRTAVRHASGLIERLRAERDEALAVIERAKGDAQAVTNAAENIRKLWAIKEALSAAPADALREHDAALIESLADDPLLRLSGHSGISIRGLREKARERREGVS